MKIDLSKCRIGALLNTSSGSCDAQAAGDLEGQLKAAGLDAVKIWCGAAGELGSALKQTARHRLDVLIVLGGDGTIRSAAETCDAKGPLLVPLPGGTMNVLPRALYGDLSWRDALAATLAAPSVQPLHGGVVEGHRFFISAIFGGPTLMAQAREAVREHDLTGAVEKGVAALSQAFSSELGYAFGNLTGVAEAVAVICPMTSRRLEADQEVLEAAAIKLESTVEALRLALTAAFSDWRNDPTVARAVVRALDIGAKTPIPAMLDGESFTLKKTVRVTSVPDAFKALVPAKA